MMRSLLALIVCAIAAAPTAAPPVTIPFELATRHVVVQLTINKSRPLSFVLDTGANVAIVQTDVAKELGLTLEGTVNVGGAGASKAVGSRVKNATWSLVGLESVKQPVTLALPLSQLSSGLGRDIDGIIGGEFIKQFVVELDYQARTLTLHDPKTFAYNGRGETLPLEFNSDAHPVLRATVTPVGGKPLEHRFILDIGAGSALTLHSPFVKEHNLIATAPQTVRAIGMAGAGGKTVGRLGRVQSLQMGSFTVKEPPVVFSEDTAGAFANERQGGNIGAQIMMRFRTFFDYGRKRLILEPSPTFGDAFDRPATGLAIRAEGHDYRRFTVKEVLEASPGSEAGFMPGDVITAVNATPAANFTLSALLEAFDKPTTHEVKVQRGEQALTLTLTPRRLF